MQAKPFILIVLVVSFFATKSFAAKIDDGYAITRTSKEKVINKKYKSKISKSKTTSLKKQVNKNT